MRRLARRIRRGRTAPAASPWEEIGARGLPERLATETGKRVLFATSVGGHPVAPTLDSLVALAVWLRGADAHLALCDGVFPACEACEYVRFPDPWELARGGPQGRLCDPCFGNGSRFYAPLPLPLHRYGDLVDAADVARATNDARAMTLDDAFTFESEGLRLGEQARASTLRFFGKADLHTEPDELVLAAARRYAAGALVAARVGERLLEAVEPDCIVAHHGVYVPQGVLGEVARRVGVRVANWGTSYRNTTVIFSHGDTYHRTFLTEPTDQWEGRALTEDEERGLLSYLAARRVGKGDWTWITPEAALRPEVQQHPQLIAELGLDPRLPVVGLLTNVLWDALIYYHGHAFGHMLEWLWATLDFFGERPDLQLIVRVHPHEVKYGNRQPVVPEIEARYPSLPPNIKIVPHDHPFNTYALMDLCRAVLIYGTKTGVELAPFGHPVVVAGDAWVRGKGFTHDVADPDEYRQLLERIETIEPLDAAEVERARRYAYHFFFRRMIPLRALDPAGGLPPSLTVQTLDDLLPGADPGLDVICDGILHGRPFVYDGSHALVDANAA